MNLVLKPLLNLLNLSLATFYRHTLSSSETVREPKSFVDVQVKKENRTK